LDRELLLWLLLLGERGEARGMGLRRGRGVARERYGSRAGEAELETVGYLSDRGDEAVEVSFEGGR
jgi:hypothetical protein